MRLTLRTLLAYLDDTLPPAEAKEIGAKVAESEAAQELIERIKQVSRRRRITTPPAAGPGKIDPNTISEYIDNVSPDQAAEVEQICLASDVHLAEVASCHQLLTIIFSEPIDIPDGVAERMIALGKGKSTVSKVRKPAAPKSEASLSATEGDEDETLRMGIPRKRQGASTRWVLGGAVAAVCILIGVAIMQILHLPNLRNNPQKPAEEEEQIAQAKQQPIPEPAKEKEEDPVKLPVKEAPKKEDEFKLPPLDLPEFGGKVDGTIPNEPVGEPDNTRSAAGQLVADPKDGVLLKRSAKAPDWQRVSTKAPAIESGQTLVSLPATRSTIQLSRGLQVKLWGAVPELQPAPQLYESMITLHASEKFDVDFTLLRGRVVLVSTKADKAVLVRMRFENPMMIDGVETFDMAVGPKAEVLIDRWSSFPRSEPFFRDPANNNRVGPMAQVGIIALAGNVTIKHGDVPRSLMSPPGTALLLWSSNKGTSDPQNMQSIPDWLLGKGSAKGTDEKIIKETNQVRQDMVSNLNSKNLDVLIAEMRESNNPIARRLSVLSLAAMDELPSLLDLLEQDKQPDVRLTTIESLRYWIATSRNAEYKLYDLLKAKYKMSEAETIMQLLHSFSERATQQPDTYELLIDYLVHPVLPIRELAAWHLYQMAPAGRNIPYSASADSVIRQRAHTAWRALVPPGQLPPAAPMPKGKA
jgi:cytoskeletal protein RodZ